MGLGHTQGLGSVSGLSHIASGIVAGHGNYASLFNYSSGGAVAPTDIQYSSHITALLAAMKASNTQRTVIGWHGMSIDVGCGSTGPTSSDWTDSWSTLGLVPQASAALNTARGGAFARGVETVSSLSGGNPFFTFGGGASVLGKQASAGGGCGQGVSLAAASAGTVAFSVSGGAGQVVKLYGYTTGGVTGVTPRYSLSGANTLATTNLPASTGAAPMAGLPYYWYETTITLANAGTTVITLLAPTGGTGSFVFYAADPDYKTVPGLTIHRLSQAGETVATLVGESYDDTDTKPTGGNWTTGANKAYFRTAQTNSLTTRMGLQGVIAGADINDVLAYSANSGAYNYGWLLTDHQRHLTNYVNAMASRGLQVLFVCGSLRAPDTPAIAGTPYTQTDVIAVYKAVAGASTNAAFLDLTAQFRDTTEALTFAAQTADTSRWLAAEAPRYVHPSAVGHAFYGANVATKIQAVW